MSESGSLGGVCFSRVDINITKTCSAFVLEAAVFPIILLTMPLIMTERTVSSLMLDVNTKREQHRHHIVVEPLGAFAVINIVN